MTASTEQEHALANLRHLYKQMVNGAVKDSAQARRIAEMLLSPAIAKIEQAARRAPVVPQGWKLVPEEATFGMLNAMHGICGENGKARQSKIDEADRKYAAMLAAAPQPPACNQSMQPTADHIPDAGQMVAAPVQLPEPIETVRYWRDAYANPKGDEHFMGHGMVVKLFDDYLALLAAQEQSK